MHPRRPSGDLVEEPLVLVLQAAVPRDDCAGKLLAAAASVPEERLRPSGRLPEQRDKGAGAAPSPFQAVLFERDVGVPNEDVAVCRPREPAAGLLQPKGGFEPLSLMYLLHFLISGIYGRLQQLISWCIWRVLLWMEKEW